MTDEELDLYLHGRYGQLVSFYDKRAQQNKRGHRVSSVFIIAVSGILAPLISTGRLSSFPLMGGFLSASVVAATAISAHFQFNENWLNYRKTWDALKREPHLRDARVGAYANSPDRNVLFVERVESIASEEGNEWLSRNVKQQDHPSGTPGAPSALKAPPHATEKR